MKELWLRLTGQTPLFFKRMMRFGLFMTGLGAVMIGVPGADFVIYVIREGKPHEHPMYLGTIIAALGAGMAYTAKNALTTPAKEEMKRELNRT